ncbi:MAG: hypothetical protein Q9221_006975 [Calogaya cf. arnoldii]
MIKRLEDLSGESTRLEHYEPKFQDADQTVAMNRINLDFCEGLLEDAKSQEEIDELREDIARRQSTCSGDQKRRDDLEERVVRLRRNVSYMEGLFAEMCQKVLADAGLVNLDIEDDSNNSEEDGGVNEPTESLDDYHYPSYRPPSTGASDVSIDELARRVAIQEYRARHAELLEIEDEFDSRQQTYEKQNARFQKMVREGTCRMTQTEFDHADFEATRGLTMDLREAEERYEEARALRNKFGHNEEDQESDFADDEYHGYPLSWEKEGIVLAPTAMINKWLEGIPDVDNIPDMAELEEDARMREQDEDCDIRSARMSDAYSCRDWTRNRRRIDRWRAMAGREK